MPVASEQFKNQIAATLDKQPQYGADGRRQDRGCGGAACDYNYWCASAPESTTGSTRDEDDDATEIAGVHQKARAMKPQHNAMDFAIAAAAAERYRKNQKTIQSKCGELSPRQNKVIPEQMDKTLTVPTATMAVGAPQSNQAGCGTSCVIS